MGKAVIDKWKVHVLEDLQGSEDGEGDDYELSLVRTSNTYGQTSWGGDDEDKIILFDEVSLSKRDLYRYKKFAQLLCTAANSEELLNV